MEIGKPFKDIESYNNSMSKSIKDKLFFIDKIPNQDYTFVDFGCADGSLINELCKIYPNSTFIGYDCSETMIQFAKKKFENINSKVIFTNNWNDCIISSNNPTILILSSVIHEIYSYAEYENDIFNFWEKVLNNNFDYIIVRDMMFDGSMNRKTDPKILNILLKNCTEETKQQLNEFETRWGSIENNLNLNHFLLKYRWKINWERELNENYFPIMINQFLSRFKDFYLLGYFEKFRIGFLDNCIYEDFGITLHDTTHIKAIFKKC